MKAGDSNVNIKAIHSVHYSPRESGCSPGEGQRWDESVLKKGAVSGFKSFRGPEYGVMENTKGAPPPSISVPHLSIYSTLPTGNTRELAFCHLEPVLYLSSPLQHQFLLCRLLFLASLETYSNGSKHTSISGIYLLFTILQPLPPTYLSFLTGAVSHFYLHLSTSWTQVFSIGLKFLNHKASPLPDPWARGLGMGSAGTTFNITRRNMVSYHSSKIPNQAIVLFPDSPASCSCKMVLTPLLGIKVPWKFPRCFPFLLH